MKRLRYTRQAFSDIDSLYTFIAQNNPSAAQRVLDRVESGIEHLSQHPELGRIGRISGTRERIIPDTHYIVAYEIGTEYIAILAIIHSSQKWPDHL